MKGFKIVPVCILFTLILVSSLKIEVYASNLNNEEPSTSRGYTEIKAEVKKTEVTEETTTTSSEEGDDDYDFDVDNQDETKENEDTDKPHTGDNNRIIVFLILFLASLVVMVSIKIYNIERQKE